MNKSVWELLEENELNINDLSNLILRIFDEVKYLENNRYSESIINAFVSFKYKNGCHSLFDLLTKAYNCGNDTYISFIFVSEVLLTYIYHSVNIKNYDLTESFINIFDSIEYYIDKMNMKVHKSDNNLHIITTKDNVSENIALHFLNVGDNDMAWRIFSFASFSTKLNDKIDILREFYTKIEGIIKTETKYKDNPTFKHTKRLLNYLRHHQEEHKIVKEIDDNLEIYCDFAFDLALQCFLTYYNDIDYSNKKAIIDQIK